MNVKRTPILVAGVAAMAMMTACDRDADRDAAETVTPVPPPVAVPSTPPPPAPVTQATPPVTTTPDDRVGEETLGDKVDHATAEMRETGAEIGDAIDDATITARVKSALVADPTLSALEIDVDTAAGVVTLTGDVDTASALERATTLARETEGVVSVENRLVVVPASG